MEALFKLNAGDLDLNFVESIRKLFHGKEIIIKVSSEMDDTTFLSLYEANEKHILDNIAAEPTTHFSGDEFQKFVKSAERHTTVTFVDSSRSNRQINTEIYYPAKSAGNNTPIATGVFPLITFGHGFVMAVSAEKVHAHRAQL